MRNSLDRVLDFLEGSRQLDYLSEAFKDVVGMRKRAGELLEGPFAMQRTPGTKATKSTKTKGVKESVERRGRRARGRKWANLRATDLELIGQPIASAVPGFQLDEERLVGQTDVIQH